MTQNADEPSRSFLAKVQGKAATCEFTTKCTEECCSEEGKSADFTNTIVKYVLVNGLVDAEIRREVLGWKRLDESSLTETVAFIEQKEMARDAIKGRTAASPAEEARPRREIKCGRCETQMTQHIRLKSGKLRKRKLCGQCWKATLQKQDTMKDRGKADETATLLVSSTWAASNQGGGTTKATSKSEKWKNHTRRESHRVAATHSKEGAKIVLDHHVFDSRAGWVRRKAWSQPMLRLSVRPCRDMYSKLNIPTPNVSSMVVDGIADTGAQVCLWSAADFHKSGYKKRDLVRVEQRVAAANSQPIEILGAVFLAVESNSLKTNLMAFVTPDIHGMYLSRQVLTELYVIPRSFPRAGDAKAEPEDKEPTPTVAAVSDRAPCGCLLRREPPARPSKLPFPCAVSNIPKMRQWLLDTFAASTFNKCPHQSLPFIKAEPITLHVDKEAKPVAHHTPCILPIHWRDKVKAGLDDDERLGVLEKVPDGVPTTWLHRMVVVPKPSGEPRRTVDLSPLNKFCKRETHVTVPPFRQARLVPANTWKTVTDAWSGYHSALIREEDKHYTTFITEWGRYRYRVAPQGYVSSNDGYSKRYDRIIESVERKTKVTDDTVMWDEDQELEAHWWRTLEYLTLVGKHGIILNGEKLQFCEKVVDFAGFRISE